MRIVLFVVTMCTLTLGGCYRRTAVPTATPKATQTRPEAKVTVPPVAGEQEGLPGTPVAPPSSTVEGEAGNVPSEGEWLVEYEPQVMDCTNFDVDVPASEPEQITLDVREEGDVLVARGFRGLDLEMRRIDSSANSSTYEGALRVDGDPLRYVLVYTREGVVEQIEGRIEGTVSHSIAGECEVNQEFHVLPIE
jgi:hypothetical protein